MITKADAVEFFGGPLQTAIALDITGQAVAKWPDTLSDAVSAKVVVAALRTHTRGRVARAFPGAIDARPLEA